jgi:hypothetical protein
MERLIVLESKDVLKTKPVGLYQREAGITLKGFQWPKLEQFSNSVVLDYNLEHKVNFYESILT